MKTKIARIVEDHDTAGHEYGARKNIRTRVEATAKLLNEAANGARYALSRSIRDTSRLCLDGHTEMVLRDLWESACQAREAYLLDATGIGELAALAKRAQREASALGDLHQALSDWAELEATAEVAKVRAEFVPQARTALEALDAARSMGDAIRIVWQDLAAKDHNFVQAMSTVYRLEGWRAGGHYSPNFTTTS